MTDASTGPSAPWRTAMVREIELDVALPEIQRTVGGNGRPYGAIWLLVRLHTVPIGVVEVPFCSDRVVPDELRSAIRASLGAAIHDHQRADGLGADPVALGGSSAPPDTRCLAHRAQVREAAPAFSVVVPCVDRPDLLLRTVRDLQDQELPPAEIIVVDNAPATSGVAAALATLPPSPVVVRSVVEPVPGSSPPRNRGASVATSAIVAFVDADVRVDRTWSVELIAPFVTDPAVGAATGLILPAELETRAQRWMEDWGGYGKGFSARTFDLGPNRPPDPLFPYAASLGSGQSMAFRADLFQRLGGFDDALGVRTPAMAGEDIAILMDAILDGHRIAYRPGAVVWHPHPTTARAFLDKLESYGVGLTAHLTRAVVRRPQALVDIGRRLPAAARYFFDARSDRNRSVQAGYPTMAVRRAELAGMAVGPIAYVVSVAQRAHRTRRADAEG